MSTDCPSETTLLACAAGSLTGVAMDEMECHLDGCSRCRRALSAALEAAHAVLPSEPGGDIGGWDGRWSVERVLGRGANGVVYAAYDHLLHRSVALKILSPSDTATPGDTKAQLLADALHEARTMARVSHANVLTIYDVVERRGALWLALELVDGETLASWLAAPRAWTAIVDVFLQAGAGLRAAHEAGVLHRDFKPANVLVRRDGIAKVTDFGLAGPVASRPEEASGEPELTQSVVTTTAGVVVAGTPAFMAPEQFRGDVPGVRSDVFSFCSALYQALYHHRPFAGDTVLQLREHVLAGELRAPARLRGPRVLLEVIRRGLAHDPDRRYEDMASLLTALARVRTRGRRRALWLGSFGGASVLAVAVAAPFTAAQPPRVCSEAGLPLESAWNAQRREAIEQAFAASGSPLADDARASVLRMLDAYAQTWTREVTSTCEATHVQRVQTQEVFAQKMVCFEDALRELEALAGVLGSADATAVAHAVTAAASLPEPQRCQQAAFYRAETIAQRVEIPDDEHTRETRDMLARVHASERVGNYAAGLAAADEVLARAQQRGDAALVAEAMVRRGQLQGRLGDGDAIATFRAAYMASRVANRSRLAAAAAADLAMQYAWSQADEKQAQLWVELAEVEAAAIENDIELTVQVGMARAELHGLTGDHAAAVETYRGLVAQQRAHGVRGWPLASTLNGLATAYRNTGALEDSVRAFEDALVEVRRDLGDRHPIVAGAHGSLAVGKLDVGDLAAAQTHAERGLDILAAIAGPPDTEASLRNTLGLVFMRMGDAKRSHIEHERSLALLQPLLPPEHPHIVALRSSLVQAKTKLGAFAAALTESEALIELARDKPALAAHFDVLRLDRAFVLLAMKDLDAAKAQAREVLANATSRGPDAAVNRGHALQLLGDIALARGEAHQARPLYADAVAAAEEVFGREHPVVAGALVRLGEAQIELRQHEPAREALERARAMMVDRALDPKEMARLERGLARLAELQESEEKHSLH